MVESRVAVAGLVCLDLIPRFESAGHEASPLPPADASLQRVGPMQIATGGAVANTGCALHRLGVPVTLLGKIGRDRFGSIVLDLLSRHHPSLVRGMKVSDADHTAYSIVLQPPGQDRRFLHHPGANDTFTADDVDFETLTGHTVLHFGYPPVMRRMYESSGAELETLFRRAHDRGMTTSLDLCAVDPASPAAHVDWPAILERALPHVDLFLPSLDELLFMLSRACPPAQDPAPPGRHTGQLAALAEWSLAAGAAVVGLKLGENGFYLRTTADPDRLKAAGPGAPRAITAWTGRELLAPCFQVAVAGTTGTGDCAIAGLLAALCAGEPPERAVTLAAAAGAAGAEQADAVSGIPPWSKLCERIQSSAGRKEVSLGKEAGWRFDRNHQVWRGPRDQPA